MLCHEALNLAARVAACARQVFLGILQFVLIKSLFSLKKFDLRLDAVLHAFPGFGGFRFQFLEFALVGIDLRFELLDAFLQSLRLGVAMFRGPTGGTQGSGKGQGDVVVGRPHCVLGELLFVRSDRERGQLVRRLERLLIDQGSLLGRPQRASASESWNDVK